MISGLSRSIVCLYFPLAVLLLIVGGYSMVSECVDIMNQLIKLLCSLFKTALQLLLMPLLGNHSPTLAFSY